MNNTESHQKDTADQSLPFLWSDKDIEECYGRRQFAIDHEQTGMLNHEEKMLRHGVCPSVLPIAAIVDGERKKVYYDFTGRIPLLQHIRQTSGKTLLREDLEAVDDALCLLLSILKGLKTGDDYLLPASRMPLTPETIFIDPLSQKVMFAYIPALCAGQSLQTRILLLMKEIEKLYHQERVSNHYEKLREAVLERNLGLEDMICLLSTIQRESSSIQWSAPSFRQLEPEETEQEHVVQAVLTEPTEKEKKEKRYLFFFALQLLFGGMLTIVFITNIFDFFSFLGFCTITVGVDLWISKSLHGFFRAKRGGTERSHS